MAPTLRVTEDAVEKPLDKVGLVRTVTALRGYRQDIIDERAGVAGAHVMVEESGAPVMLVVRLKVVADKLTEIELVATRSRTEGLIFNIDGLQAPTAAMNYVPRPEQLATRDDAIRIAMKYPEGLDGREDLRRRERAVRPECLPPRERPADGRRRLHVRSRLQEHLRTSRSRSSSAWATRRRA